MLIFISIVNSDKEWTIMGLDVILFVMNCGFHLNNLCESAVFCCSNGVPLFLLNKIHWWIEPWSNISNMFLAFFKCKSRGLVSRHYLSIFDILYPFYPHMWCHKPTSFREAFRSSSEAGGLIPRMFIGVWWCMCIWVNYNSPNLKCWAILGMIPLTMTIVRGTVRSL